MPDTFAGSRFHSIHHRRVPVPHTVPGQPGHEDVPTWVWPAALDDTGFQPVDPAQWRLQVDGLVTVSRAYRLAELYEFPKITQNRRWVSRDGWSVRVAWEGVLFQHLVDAVHPSSDVRYIRQQSLTGQVVYLPFREALSHRLLLAYGAQGRPLPAIYGGPLQMMIFHRLKHFGVSQLARLSFTAERGDDCTLPPGDEGDILPGNYYAFDLKQMKPIRHPGEVTEY